ncbi:MAG: N-formylglutamate amidohydrolase [Geminicoccaceae bacterium]
MPNSTCTSLSISERKTSPGDWRAFSCTLVLQRYSRLVIDCNRPPGTAQSIPVCSGGIDIPGNAGLAEADRIQREREIFAPYAAACRDAIARPHIRFAFSIHSFTPCLQGEARPWDIAFLFRSPYSRAARLADLACDMFEGCTVGRNEPYAIEDGTDWFIPVCAEPRQIPHCLIEVRNDHLETDAGCDLWGDRLARLLRTFMEECDDAHA